VIADGAPSVAEAVRGGKMSVSVAERLVRKVPDQEDQEKIVAMSTVGTVVRRNDNLTKQLIDAIDRPVAAPQSPPRKGKAPVGLIKGNEAIDLLKTISPSDEQYLRGYQVVLDFIRHNTRLAPATYQADAESREINRVENCKRWGALLTAAVKLQKIAEGMADAGILTVERMKEADEDSIVYLLADAVATLPAVQLFMDVCCEAGGPL
jgi:hypothetical protein